MNLDQYLPVLMFILVGIAVGVIPQVLGYILGPNRPDQAVNRLVLGGLVVGGFGLAQTAPKRAPAKKVAAPKKEAASVAVPNKWPIENIAVKHFRALEKSTGPMFAAMFKGADAVVFAAGSGTGESSEIDSKGVRKTLGAAKKAGVKRYLAISSIGASTGMKISGEWATAEMKDYYKHKRAAGKAIAASGLDWTILEPGTLTEGKLTGKVTASLEALPEKSISRADVAAVAIAALGEKKTIGKALQLTSGKSAIADALKAALAK